MASNFGKEFKTSASSKAADQEVVSDVVELSPKTKDHVLVVKSDNSVSGAVEVELEMSPDGKNWCPARSKSTSSAASSTGDIIGNTQHVELTATTKNKHGRGLMTRNLGADTTYSGGQSDESSRTDGADFMYHRIQTTKSFNYSQWIKSSDAPSATYNPVLFRHAGYDNFSNAKTLELTQTDTQNLCNARSTTAENGGAVESASTGDAFNATGGIIQDDDDYDLTTNAWSIGFWFKSNVNVGSGNDPDFGDGQGYNGADLSRAMLLSTHTASSNWNGGLFFQFFSGESVSAGWTINGSVGVFDRLHKTTTLRDANESDTGGNWMDGNWHHVMVVKASADAPNLSSTSGLTYYLDGVQLYKTRGTSQGGAGNISNVVDKTTVGYGSLCTKHADGTNTNTIIGPLRSAASFTNIGKMDNICFWKSDQSSNASTIYNSGKPLLNNPGTPTTYLRMEDSSNLDKNSVTGNAVATDKSAYTTLRVQQEVLTSSDSIYVAGQPTLNEHFENTDNLSISGWFKTSDLGTLFSNTEGAFAKGLRANLISNGIQISFKNATGEAFLTYTGGAKHDGNWHHLLVVHEPGHGSKKQRMYIDGVEVATANASLTSDSLSGANGFTLLGDGQQNKNATSPSSSDSSKLQATISNWSIHAEALADNAALQLYSNGNVRNIKNLPDVTAASIKAWYQFNDTSNPINDIVGTNHLLYQGPTTDVNTKAIKASTQTTAFNAATRDFILDGNKNPFGNDNNMPLLSSAFSMSFWLYIPSGSSTWDSIIAFSATDTRNHFKLHNISNNLSFSFAGGGEGADYSIDYSGNHDAWKHIVMVKPQDTVENLAIFVNGVKKAVTQTYNTADGADPATTSWGTAGSEQGCSEFFLFGNSRAYTSSNSSGDFGSGRSGRVFKIDHLGTYSKALTYGGVSDNQTATGEVAAIYNSGNYIDLSTLAGSYNLEKYFKFGDHSSDVNSGTLKYYDEVNDAAYFEEQDNTNGGTVTLTSSDAPYHAPIENISTRQINATDATLIADGINGHGMTMSITKSFNFTTKKWVSTSDQDAAICLSFNGFQDQAEYFALWKCSQNLPGASAVNVLDGNYHNLILSYRGRNDFSGDNVDPGDVVKFGPGATNLNYNWTLSIDGVETTSLNGGSGADYIGGLNTLSTASYGGTLYNVGFAIQDRHLKHTVANGEEVYKPHTQFSSGILDGADNKHAFQGYVDETSFHSDTWWVNSDGTAVDPNDFNGEKPATIYGNTTALSNRGAGKEYPVGVPYPLTKPQKLVTSGEASDIEGTNQYINPLPFNSGSNANGGLEGHWRWGDTSGDCSEKINDVKSHADGNDNNDLSAENLTTADVENLTESDSIYLASATASSGTTTSFDPIKLENISEGLQLANIESPIFSLLRIKWKGAGSITLGRDNAMANIYFTNRIRRRNE